MLSQSILLSVSDCDDIQYVDTGHFHCAYYTKRSPDKQTTNEDSLAIIPYSEDTVVFVIADGLGGQRDGALASSTVVETLDQTIKHAADTGVECRSAILDAIEKANREIMAIGSGAATTLALVELNNKAARSIHIGDSEILITGQRGKLKFQTVAHSPVGYAIEAGLLEHDEALQHKDRHIVSNCVGVEDMRIDMGPVIKLARYDTVLLASDGIFDNLKHSELIDLIRKGALNDVAGNLLAKCMQSMQNYTENNIGKPDDHSFIVLRRI